MDNEVLEFIHKRWTKDANWLDGNCYWFAHILISRFPYLEMYYLPIRGHFVVKDTRYHDRFYDWTGFVELDEMPIRLEAIAEHEPNWYLRLMRDCRD